jgi:hypothetical protein
MSMETTIILGLEWHRWLFFLFAWLPWLLVEIWYFRRMKTRFDDQAPSGQPSDEGGEE